jgi:flagellar biosynthesis protein FlhA
MAEAVRTYSVLTVGDGLVTAIPALLVSVASGIVVTRSDSGQELGTEVMTQMFGSSRPLGIASGTLAAMALIPGLPTTAFLTLAAGAAAMAVALRRSEDSAERAAAEAPPLPRPSGEEPIETLLAVDPLTVEVGYELVELAADEGAGGLPEKIRGIRREIALELGFVVPPVRVRDNVRLSGDEYRILLRGAEIGRGKLPRGRALAIDPGDVLEPIEGEKTADPAFGIPALWVRQEIAERARIAGYTVVDRASVLATHLAELVRRHAADLLGRQETHKLLEQLSKSAPKLVEELVPERFSLGQVQKVLQALLRERVSIRDLGAIAEALLDGAGQGFDLPSLVARARQAIGRTIVQPLVERNALRVVTVSPEIEEEAIELVGSAPGDRPRAGDPSRTQALLHRIAQALREVPAGSRPAVLCGSAASRMALRRLSEHALPTVAFLSVHEIPDGVRVQSVGQVR